MMKLFAADKTQVKSHNDERQLHKFRCDSLTDSICSRINSGLNNVKKTEFFHILVQLRGGCHCFDAGCGGAAAATAIIGWRWRRLQL
jgi:hypothetical protein